MEYKKLRPSQVLLDSQNPRLPDGTSNDKEAINRLLAEGYDQLLGLARDLTERGEANPTELPILVKSGAKYVVLEGNRRFAALKLLGDPKLADDPAHRTAFERLKRKAQSAPVTLYCAVARDRDEADPWITLRHTGANGGVGVRVWSAEQNARHRRRMNVTIDSGTRRSIAIADELTETYQSDSELVGVIAKVRANKLTNIGRFFSGVMLTRMQLQVKQIDGADAESLLAKHNAEQLHAYFRWSLQILDQKSVDAFKNDDLRGALLNNNAAVLPNPSESFPEFRRLANRPYGYVLRETEVESTDNNLESGTERNDESQDDAGTDYSGDDLNQDAESDHAGASSAEIEAADSDSIDGTEASDIDNNSAGEDSDGELGDGSLAGDSADQDAGAGSSGRKRDARPEKSLYSMVRLTNLSPNIQRLLREAKALSIDENYAVACVLARVILELTVSDPKVLQWSGKQESDKLAAKIRACIFKLDPFMDQPVKRTRRDLIQAYLETNEIGVTYLHQFMHNPSAKSDPHLARRFSSAYAPLLNSINEEAK